MLGTTTVILAALSAACAFAAYSVSDGAWLTIGAGVLSGLAAAVALLQTVGDPADVIAGHQRAAAEYGILRRELEQAILSERITDDRLAEIRQEWTRVEATAPSLTARASRSVAFDRTPTGMAGSSSAPAASPSAATEPPAAAEPPAPAPAAIEPVDEPVKELTTG